MNDNPFAVIGAIGGFAIFISIAFAVFMLVSYWKLFEKADRPGWAAIIPIYNTIVYIQVAGLSPWFVLIFLAAIVPIVGSLLIAIFVIYLAIKVAAAFGKSALFGIGVAFLPVIFIPILAFGSAEYKLGKKEEEDAVTVE